MEEITVDNIYSNLIEFNSNKIYRDYNDISLFIEKDYNISKTSFVGYYYKELTLNNLISGDITFKIDYNDIIIDSYEVLSTSTKFNVISPVIITNDKYIQVEKTGWSGLKE